MIYLLAQEIFNYPHQNGITTFVLGGLAVLTVYHFLLYFQHKDKSYLFYSLYTFLLFTRNSIEPENSFIYFYDELTPILNTMKYYSPNLEWAYNTIYFVFAFTFIDLKSYSKKWHRFIFGAVYFLFALNIFVEILYRITGNESIYPLFFMIFIVLLLILSIIGYIPLFKIKGFLKYYIIVGSLILLLSSVLAYIISRFKLMPFGSDYNTSIFFIGMALENIFFSLGLGHKQKMILEEKNKSQLELINQLQENEVLRETVQDQLKQDFALLQEKSKNQKLVNLKEKADKELAELKITSLRSQMNPHFIFNSLNAIKQYIISNEKQNAVYYLNKFSKLIRKILTSTREKEISLADEIETMELYINIENIRFNNDIAFSLEVDKNVNLDTIKIPALILQPFIENAIWHGLSSKKKDRRLLIYIEKPNDNYIHIVIEDNGIGRVASAAIKEKKLLKKDSVGIKLTKERLGNFAKEYKNDYSIVFTDLFDDTKTPSGTRVCLKIPLQ